MIIGVLGVGHLAHSIVRRLIAVGHPPGELLLSPRGLAAKLAAAYSIPVAKDNAALVDAADLVLLAVRPMHAAAALDGLPWGPSHLIVSACAGMSIDALQPSAPRARIMRIMPMTASEIGASPTAVYPDMPEARALLDPLGPVLVLNSEGDFEVATVSAAIYGWAQDLIRQAANWSSARGLDPVIARQLVSLTFVAAGRIIAEKPDSMDQLLTELVTPGGITERGLHVLAEHGVPAAWDAACDAVIAKLHGTG